MSAVTEQPESAAGGGSNVPPGLEYLVCTDTLIVSQKVELAEAIVGVETANKYTVKNGAGQHVYFAVEDSSGALPTCCSYLRAFNIRVMDSSNRHEVLHLRRPLRCQNCCYPCWQQELEVSAQGRLLGTVRQRWSLLRPLLVVCRPDGSEALHVRGPALRWAACCGSDFSVLSADDGEELGFITKTWSGLARELFTDSDRYGIVFPEDLEVDVKATLLGAAFLIDFMFFESSLCIGDCGCCMVC
ncbi:Phospholipid scramblase 2 [Amphibalanus amphitrite]|uniref:Phospholipid scramblase n=1 Tax=Amphibalanus amphitrite TaxID=1232801 RepID=A0A6A4VYW5_AMPAM|nr:phospholipid scramblase 2-like [Amphibalanus amphitrite]XP_043215323.1 phospholipid scramblase 2-like [Amphibalanus amphitrite]KAF0298079.1 Phospholipid scramblase 2 [Amphibalanus amphitrite]